MKNVLAVALFLVVVGVFVWAALYGMDRDRAQNHHGLEAPERVK